MLGFGFPVGTEIPGVGEELAAVEFNDSGCDVVQEASVMGDEKEAAVEFLEDVFQPEDGFKVEVVRWFV